MHFVYHSFAFFVWLGVVVGSVFDGDGVVGSWLGCLMCSLV